MSAHHYPLYGAGLGLRRAHLGPLSDHLDAGDSPIGFIEVAPENWLGVGGRPGKGFAALAERLPLVCHGLSLSLGGPAPLDETFLLRLKRFFARHRVACYSEHLSYCSDGGHLYDLMPIPFSEEAVHHVAGRIRRAQAILERPIAIENISYYAAPGQQMSELEFLLAVLEEADCRLLLDVNNAYVNGHNHGYDPLAFIQSLPGERIDYLHVAGHYVEADGLIVDTHGAAVIDPVWQLLEQTYRHFGVLPTLLERDFNLPPLPELLTELGEITLRQITARQKQWHHSQGRASHERQIF